ncbi:MAG: DNA mismatch repair protein MutS [Gemmatimonadetes bacterium]|nr:DNA mismatch repair protein MutS [Gemmatimonadota bacterium]
MPKQDDTPLMQQWRDAKSRHPDALVFFRVGDFYELFNEDAIEGARLLGLTLTSRNNGGAAEVPLAGVPVRARDEYLARLVRLGRRVAVCDQVEDPALARGIVRREVTETITPGAVLADALLTERRNNWLIAIADAGPDKVAIAAADISTGDVWAKFAHAGDLTSELAAAEAREVLLPQSWEERRAASADGVLRTFRPDWLFDRGAAEDELRRRYDVHSLESFGIARDDGPLVAALGALLAYLAEVQPSALHTLRAPRLLRDADAMVLDEMTRRNLELVEPLRAGVREGDGTLISVLDETVTAMGGRLLRGWLMRPLVDAAGIWARQDAVGDLRENAPQRRALRAALENVRDLARLATKAGTGRITPREMRGLGASLDALPAVLACLDEASAELLRNLAGGLDPMDDVRALIAQAISDEPPATLGDGGTIRAGWDSTLDELRGIRDGAHETIARLQAAERERTGITSLKVGYNRVFGYYIEVSKPNLERVPAEYERRQTLANAERYVTRELKEWEARILGAEERIAEAEARLFGELRDRVVANLARLQDTAGRVAQLDVLAALAFMAERGRYVRPEVHTGFDLVIRGGRHPVVETMMPRETFIPNDVSLDEHARIMILTGPNMAGKSTLLRQVGLIQLLGQMGSFVPAGAARLPICDRIFTRVGASDNLVRGQSTFMVEMQETAAILHGATARSLVLLDEIGRGTATYDGVSIAWAVTEFLHEVLGAKTIFATHYHELTQLAELLPALTNANVAVREAGHDIVFLHQLRPGGANRSYGIEVGRLAGLPASVIERAREILRDLEGTHSGGGAGLGREGRYRPRSTPAADQLSLFHREEHPVLVRLRAMRTDELTPLEALNLLAELAALARGDLARGDSDTRA